MKKALSYLILLLPLSAIAQSTDMYFDKGVELFKSKDYNGAMDYFTKEIELNPRNLEAYNYRGAIKGELGDFKGAIDEFSKEIAISPNADMAYKSACKNYKFARVGDEHYIKVVCYYNIARYESQYRQRDANDR